MFFRATVLEANSGGLIGVTAGQPLTPTTSSAAKEPPTKKHDVTSTPTTTTTTEAAFTAHPGPYDAPF